MGPGGDSGDGQKYTHSTYKAVANAPHETAVPYGTEQGAERPQFSPY